jgi:cell division FtsZ-interacting protein ZapD
VQQMRELAVQTSKTSSEKISGKWTDLASKLDALSKKADLTTQYLKELFDSTKGSNGFTDLDKDLKDSNSELNNFITQLKNVENVDAKSVDAFVAKLKEMGLLSSATQIGLKNVDGTITDLKPHVASASEAITSFSGALM